MRIVRVVARVLCMVLFVAMAASAAQLIAIVDSLPRFPPDTYGADGDDSEEARRAREVSGYCARVDAGPSWARFIWATEREALARACAGYAIAAATDERERASELVTRAGYGLSLAFERPVGLVFACAIFALAALFGVFGMGTVGALIASLPIALVVNPDLAPIAFVTVPIFVLVTLATAPWGQNDVDRRPRDATTALVVSILLVPAAAIAIVAAGWAGDSYRLEKRLGFTLAFVAIGWVVAGIPTLVLVARAKRILAAHPEVGGRTRIAIARFAVWSLGMATAVGIGHSFVQP